MSRKKIFSRENFEKRLLWAGKVWGLVLLVLTCSCKSLNEDPYLDLAKWQETGKIKMDRSFRGVRYKNFTMDHYKSENKWNVPRIAQTPLRAIWELADPEKPELSIVGVVLWDKTHGLCSTIEQEKAALDQEFQRVPSHIRILSYESRITEKFGIKAVEYELTAVAAPAKNATNVRPQKIYSCGYRFVWPKGSIDRFCAEFTERGPVLSGRTLQYARDFFSAIGFAPQEK